MDSTLTHRIAEVRSKIIHACERVQRDPQSVQLLLASKTVDPMIIRDAFHAGASIFGENKVQEFIEKQPALSDLPIEWHFIGQLQSNKVKNILSKVQLIHSLDRLTLAEELEKQAEKMSLDFVNVLLEINSSNEANKGGIAPTQVLDFLNEIKKFERIRIQGLMTVAIDGSEKDIRDCFRLTKQLLEKIRPAISGNTLSMGMSGDFELAIEEGSTLVRLGSSVFGKRI
jgi:pyridoxal phosphate enzyme (YggS family)